jgi:hypothetical protein
VTKRWSEVEDASASGDWSRVLLTEAATLLGQPLSAWPFVALEAAPAHQVLSNSQVSLNGVRMSLVRQRDVGSG